MAYSNLHNVLTLYQLRSGNILILTHDLFPKANPVNHVRMKVWYDEGPPLSFQPVAGARQWWYVNLGVTGNHPIQLLMFERVLLLKTNTADQEWYQTAAALNTANSLKSGEIHDQGQMLY